jgi:hypothetical protein
MVSLILFIRDFFPREEIIQVRRMLPTKNLRAHLVGLTLGFILTSLNLAFGLDVGNLFARLVILLWFALTTYFSGLFLVVTTLLFIFLRAASPIPGSAGELVMVNANWYLFGYLLGALFAIFYNDLVFLYLNFLDKKENVKIVFAYDTTKKINIIKSPISSELKAFDKLFARKPKLKEQRLYKYRIANPPEQPYTIAFVANPKIHKRAMDENNEFGYAVDPIIHDLPLFLRAVDRALFSLELDPVVGRPEIWSRVRVITVFDPALITASGPQVGMLEEFQKEIADSNGNPIENNLIDPMKRMKVNFDYIFNGARDEGTRAFDTNQIDVIYGVTASPTHDRSTAHYSDYIEVENIGDDLQPNEADRPGPCYKFKFDPCAVKEKVKNENEENEEETDDCRGNDMPLDNPDIILPDFSNGPGYRKRHDFYATQPGRVALNVLGARTKTYVHEFAHAMSSVYHGSIADEYVDYFIIRDPNSETPSNDEKIDQIPHFFVNRIERNLVAMESSAPIPVPKVFAEYNCTRYDADGAHPSAEESWAGYFPDKYDETTPCTMDRTADRHHFDELLSRFIYDRLMTKTTRPHQ